MACRSSLTLLHDVAVEVYEAAQPLVHELESALGRTPGSVQWAAQHLHPGLKMMKVLTWEIWAIVSDHSPAQPLIRYPHFRCFAYAGYAFES